MFMFGAYENAASRRAMVNLLERARVLSIN